MKMKDSRGVTMIEMVVVLAIIAILAAILTPMITGYVDRARLNAAKSDLNNIAAAATQFATDAKFWPIYIATPANPNDETNVYSTLRSEGIEPTFNATATGWTAAVTSGSSATMASVLNDPAKYVLTGSAKFRGPYLEFGSDPWGGRYYLTALNLMPSGVNVAYVISSGPDQEIDTPFVNARATTTSLVGTDDDIVVRIR